MSAFTRKQKEKCQQISNDISEGIDNGESRKQLRMAVDYYASLACDSAMEVARLKTDLAIVQYGHKIISSALPKTKMPRSPINKL